MSRIAEATTTEAGIWLAATRQPASSLYNVPVCLLFDRPVDLPRLRVAVAGVIARHPRLGSGFVRRSGELVRIESPQAPVAFEVSACPQEYRAAAADEWAMAVTGLPFVLATAPLLRVHVRQYADRALAVLVVHHIVCDGWSADLLAEQVANGYLDGMPWDGIPDAPGIPEAESGPGDPAAQDHWRGVLDSGAVLRPPADRQRAAADAGVGASGSVSVPLDRDAMAEVRTAAVNYGSSPALVGLTAWLLLLHGWSGNPDGLSSLIFADRHSGNQHEVGQLARAVPVSSSFVPGRRVDETVGMVTEQVLTAMEHLEADPADLLAAGQASPAESSVYMHVRQAESAWTGAAGTVTRFHPGGGNAKFGLSCAFVEREDGAEVCVDYDTTVYAQATARRLAGQLAALLSRMPVGQLTQGELLALADEPSILDGGPVRHSSLLGLVREQARTRPDAVAIESVVSGHTRNYRELWSQAGQLACAIGRIADGAVVALPLEPSIQTFTLWLAVLRAGRAYLPLDLAFPDAQLQMIMADADPGLVICQAAHRDRIAALTSSRVVEPEELDGHSSAPDSLPEVDDDATMAILFTSGSTGRPKGVVLSHRGLARLMQPEFLAIGRGEVFSQLSPLNFDGASYEVWGAFAHGARLVLIDKEVVLEPTRLREVVRAAGVTTMALTTPLLNRLIDDAPDLLQSINRVYFGGETISVAHILRGLAFGGGGKLVHSYGPTENSFTSSRRVIDSIEPDARTVSIGTPVPGTRMCVVLPGTWRVAPVGMPGELLVAGDGLAREYLGDQDRTREKFVPVDGLHPDLTGRAYRTGDQVRLLPAGELEFLGRLDNQVKIRSQRVEIGEVEHALGAHPGAREVCVIATGSPKELIGYVVGAPDLSPLELRAFAAARLPRFAVPTRLVVVDALPLKPNGKVDRDRLPDPATVTERAAAPAAAVPAPAVPAQVRPVVPGAVHPVDGVRGAWAHLLGHLNFADDDNFFDAGGNSLMLVALQETIEQRTGHWMTIGDLMRLTTVVAQARAVAVAMIGIDGVNGAGGVEGVVVPEGWRVLKVSAATGEALVAGCERVADLLAGGGVELGDVAHTLETGRDRFEHRRAVLARSQADAARALRGGGRFSCDGRAVHAAPRLLLIDRGMADPRADQLAALCAGRYETTRATSAAATGVDLTVDFGRLGDAGVPEELRMALLVARLWCQGVELDVPELVRGRRVRLPSYSYAR